MFISFTLQAPLVINQDCFHTVSPEGSSVTSSQEEWNENVVEPELEFDEMGLELAAEDGKMVLV